MNPETPSGTERYNRDKLRDVFRRITVGILLHDIQNGNEVDEIWRDWCLEQVENRDGTGLRLRRRRNGSSTD